MWGSSFADLAKKAAELQEQATQIHDIVVVHVVMVPSMVLDVGGGAAVDAASYVSVLLLDFVSHPN